MNPIHILVLTTFDYAKTHMVKTYELYSNYTPIIIQAVGGIQTLLLLVMLIMLYKLNKKVDRLEEKVDKIKALKVVTV